ncbi:hypothetical protein BWQ96_05676 [Gracilariopsis chorda]|uniref:Uncharacterized protein n=1 Tax=Gracilariopsis chorda TaxID=448386 RepID=A0A2V3IR76_9FLOR|nr:hypothetical protein BWQ96_05676 [Gracilariopsis chorda]|eukprot:PXF44599.1 hypothetical protein BWQ96_05676 [Gracilariopsis chorda]
MELKTTELTTAGAFQAPIQVNAGRWISGKPVFKCNWRASRRVAHRRSVTFSPACVDTQQPTQVSEDKVFDASSTALQEGIKAVAVGKHGSKPVPAAILPDIDAELALCNENACEELLWQRASFLGALFVKAELSADEMSLLVRRCGNSAKVAGRKRMLDDLRISAGEVLASITDAEGELETFAMRVLCDEELDERETATLGALLFSKNGDWAVKALIAHVMRVRHESASELAGLSVAAWRSVKDAFVKRERTRHTYALMAEPYDGTRTWDMLTPLVAKHLHDKYGIRVVLGVGESSGPKYGPNLREVAREMGIAFVRDGDELERAFEEGADMVAVDQGDASEGLHRWVRMRRAIVKRPGIASAEKFADVIPGGSEVFIGSAFHESYMEKMAAAAEAIGYSGYVIVGRGVEGTIGVGVGARKKALLLCGWKGRNGGYGREQVVYRAEEDGVQSDDKAVKGAVTAGGNASKLRAFMRVGGSGDDLFDRRARATVSAVEKALRVLQRHGCGAVARL